MTHPSPELAEKLSAAVNAVSHVLVTVHGTSSPITATGVSWGDDHIVTTHSGTWGDEGLRVGLPDGRTLDATVVGRDASTDLLVLSVAEAGLPAPDKRSLDGFAPGALAIVVGRRRGEVRASWGHVTAAGGTWTSPGGGTIDGSVEVDASLPRGLTGSALVDVEGKLIGINTRSLRRGGSTIPVVTIDRVVAAVKEHGSLRQGWLGLSVLPVPLSPELTASTGQSDGLILLEVVADGPAAQAGWLQGDVLLKLDGEVVNSPRGLRQALGPHRVGKVLTATRVRAGTVEETQATVAARPEEEPEHRGRKRHGFGGHHGRRHGWKGGPRGRHGRGHWGRRGHGRR